jgi:hypothetical protein
MVGHRIGLYQAGVRREVLYIYTTNWPYNIYWTTYPTTYRVML